LNRRLKLEDFIAKQLRIGRGEARKRIISGVIEVAGQPEQNHRREVSRFEEVTAAGSLLQEAIPRLYLMLHKPAGILSATSDPIHQTVLDLIDHPDKDTLHLAGRLDRSSTGLILLTNDGSWSESLTLPGRKVEKVYLVETNLDIPHEAITRFAEGFHFPTEGITTLPSKLEILGPRKAKVTLREGRYHQIKRMFHRIDGIRLASLHRIRIGGISLPDDLAPGEWRLLTVQEVENLPSDGMPENGNH